MTETRILKRNNVATLLSRCMTAGKKVYAPVKKNDLVDFQLLSDPAEMTFDYIQTVQSPKFVLFPRVEELFSYSTDENNELHLEERDATSFPETVLFGVRPCDAKGFLTLEAVFKWDYPDTFYLTRRAKCTIMSVACQKADQWCFCTSVGGGPDNPDGSDILLLPLADGDYLAQFLTDKGREFLSEMAEFFEAVPPDQADLKPVLADVPVRFELDQLRKHIDVVFNSDIWAEQSQACIGCGACAFVCPSCVCFDIQDEGTAEQGRRLRCWDSCGFSLFTLHTSGHNPREVQSQRWRQRLMHKFSYLPDRLETMGCVGCGRCSRSCPAGMDLLTCLAALAEVNV
ncbi:4Fe-4S dicluster domain-containing protein [bacterium]|nr:4Fe-4S dicluster domain-containing protein [bacterium]